ncbi:protein UNUSUAL FLORAL ORGANS-like [Cornus florida]|uniref:protein UNUSUAL FLORAL ORGANS-like n=1 Tax=Cornus florida TaxID=4283 RepID=UPI002896DF0D|nr:protein UNUSUAL FLORAL ORGANS-like [Cornus florida]
MCVYIYFHSPLVQKPFTSKPSMFSNMWSNIPSDLLANVFSFLPPDSLARARSVCRFWHTCADIYTSYPAPPGRRRHPAWFIALPTRSRGLFCYAYNPISDNWHVLSLEFVPGTVRPIAQIAGLVLFRPTSTTALQLAICNPFTRQYRPLPILNITRTNPVVGVIELDPAQHGPIPYFRVYVAGGTSEAPSGGASYEPTLEMYDSQHDTWQMIGSMPVEFAVRLTVWTPNESVYSNGVLYWVTSARAYTVMGFEIGTNKWTEVSVPLADLLEFATLVLRNGKLTLVGGTSGRDACIWQLGDGDTWRLIDKVPVELGLRFLCGKGSWGNTKCVGIDGVVCLYRVLGSGMILWREAVDKGKWEWFWVEGCFSMKGKQVQSFPIKGVLLHPNLSPSCILN